MRSGACGLQLAHAWRALQVRQRAAKKQSSSEGGVLKKSMIGNSWGHILTAGVRLSSYRILPSFLFPQGCLLSSSFLRAPGIQRQLWRSA